MTRRQKQKFLNKSGAKEVSKRYTHSLTIEFKGIKHKNKFIKFMNKAYRYKGKNSWYSKYFLYSTGYYLRINIDN